MVKERVKKYHFVVDHGYQYGMFQGYVHRLRHTKRAYIYGTANPRLVTSVAVARRAANLLLFLGDMEHEQAVFMRRINGRIKKREPKLRLNVQNCHRV